MRRLELTLPTPEANLALDEALLAAQGEWLRFWEAPSPVVVLGRGSRAAGEADLGACEAAGAPVLRRASGGCAVVAGPGCLMYALALDAAPTASTIEPRGARLDVDAAHRLVLPRLARALAAIEPSVVVAGTSDLAYRAGGELRKFSGNSVRLARGRLLYHGTLLYGFDLKLVARLLLTPPREPAYRAGRTHGSFVANLPTDGSSLRAALAAAWPGEEVGLNDALAREVDRLVAEKYNRPAWNLSR